MSGRRTDPRTRAKVSGWVRAVPIMAAFLVGAASFTLSFFAQAEVSTTLGAVPANLSGLVPIIIDGGILAGSASVWASSTRGARKDPVAYLTIIGLLALSVIINVHHAAAEGGVLGSVIAGAPPVVLLLCLELVAAQARRDALETAELVHDTPAAAPVGHSVPTPVPTRAEVQSVAAARAELPAGSLAAVPARAVPPLPRPAPAWEPAARPAALPSPVPPAAAPAPRSLAPATQALTSAPALPTPAPRAAPAPAQPHAATPPAVRTAAATTPSAPVSVSVPAPAEDTAVKPGSQAATIRAKFAEHVRAGGDPLDPSVARTIAESIDSPLPSVRKIIAQERKVLDAPAA